MRSRRRRRRAARTIGVLVALVAMLATLPAGAEAVTQPRTLLDLRPVGTAAVATDFPIDHLGVRFDLPAVSHGHEAADHVAVRFRHGDDWGPWTAVHEDGAQQPGRWTGALVAADDADGYQVRGVPAGVRGARVMAVNTTDGPAEVVGWRHRGAADAVTPCKSRADWGADESARSGNRVFAPAQMLTVHHTASGNQAAIDDPDAVVRAIYSWHTEGNGWDDIGYQALIAPDGTLYEGRWSGSDSRSCRTEGGDGSDFGHATDATDAEIVTGAHAGGHNTGNFGIALLGTYTDVAPTADARTTLVAHLADLAGRHGLDPTGAVAYDNGVNAGTFPAIAGHRDINATECPGGVLYADLPQVRQDVAAAMDAGDGGDGGDGTDSGTVAVHGEQPVSGTVTGTHADTVSDGDGAQSITEVESGGKPSRRHALLEHVWFSDLPAGQSWTLTVDAAATATGDGDDFGFAVSADGASWSPVVTVPGGSDGVVTGDLPYGMAGLVHIRVVDTVRSAGARTLDTITIDHLVLTGIEVADPPPDSGGVTLSATPRKVKGEHVVDLAWTGASSVTVERDGQVVATVDGQSWTDHIGAKGGATYTYRVCAGETCSAHVTVSY